MCEFSSNPKSPECFLGINVLKDSVTPTSPSKYYIRALIDYSYVDLVPLHQFLY